MSDTQRAVFLALYAASIAAIAIIDHGSPLYRALCQVRAEIERSLNLPQHTTRRNAA
jgi:hypothetical protein